MLNWSTRSGVAVEGGSRELCRKFTLLDVFGKQGVIKAGGRDQVLRQLGLHDLLMDQLVEGVEIYGALSL